MAQAEQLLPEHPRQPERVRLGNISFGIYLPQECITNEQIEQWGIRTKSGRILTADDIRKRTGIERRFKANSSESPIEMGVKSALATGDLEDIDVIMTATSYPLGQNVSQEIGHRLQTRAGSYLDIHAACSGFTRGPSIYEGLWG